MSPRGLGLLAALTVCALAGCGSGGLPVPPPSDASSGALEARLATRAAHTMTALPDGRLLVAGGCVVDGCTTASADAFVLADGQIAAVRPMGDARDAHTATALADGRILVTGGFASEGSMPLRGAEVFDPGTGEWASVGAMSIGRGGHAAARLGDGRVLVAGGWVSPLRYTASTEVFDPVTGQFAAGPDLPEAVDGLAAAPLADGCVLVVGGQRSPGMASADASRVCPDLRLNRVGDLGAARFKHGVVALSSGAVVVVGGTPDDRQLLASTEVYDPVAAGFRPGPALQAGRYKLNGSVAVLPDDRIVVAGGGFGVEILDLAVGSRRVDAAGTGRASFSTVGLIDSRVVVLGGYDEQIRLTRTFRTLDASTL